MPRTFFLTVVAINLVVGCSQSFNAMNSSRDTDPWVIRTDFSNDEQWAIVRDLIAAPQKTAGMEFYAYVKYVSDDRYRDQSLHDLILSLPDNYPGMFCFVVDRECIEKDEHPVLVVGFYPSDNESFSRPPLNTPAGDIETFRALPSQVQSIQNNLSIANMGFEEFAESVDDDGVFRGFPR